MIDFKNIKRSAETTYTLIACWEAKTLRFALQLAGEEDWKILAGRGVPEDVLEQVSGRIPEGDDIRMYAVLASHFVSDEISAILPYIAYDPDIQAAQEEEDYRRMREKWDEIRYSDEFDKYYADEEYEDGEDCEDGEADADSSLVLISITSSDFFQLKDAENETKALLAENWEDIRLWLQDEEAGDRIWFERSMEKGELCPHMVARRGNSVLCQYLEMFSVLRLEKDADSEEGFRIDDVYIDNKEYLREFDAQDENVPTRRYMQLSEEEIREMDAECRKLCKNILDGRIFDGTILDTKLLR